MIKRLRKWWTAPAIRPMPAMAEDRLAPQEFERKAQFVQSTPRSS